MKTLLILLICFLSLNTFSQNNIDNNGFKQGKWTWTKDVPFIYIAILPNPSGKNSDSITCHVILKDGFYKNNKRDSLWHEFKNDYSWRDKKLIVDTICELNYKDDKLDGNLKFYQSNGLLRTEIVYKNGLPKGPIKLYDESGNLKYTGFYDSNNQYIDLISYDSKSKPLKYKVTFNINEINVNWLNYNELKNINR